MTPLTDSEREAMRGKIGWAEFVSVRRGGLGLVRRTHYYRDGQALCDKRIEYVGPLNDGASGFVEHQCERCARRMGAAERRSR